MADNGEFVVLYGTTWNKRQYFKRMTFRSKDEYDCWKATEMAIKWSCAHINERRYKGKLSDENPWFKRQIIGWKQMVCVEMASRFGNQSVPIDIRKAVHDVDDILGCPHTDFGPDDGYYE